jgi:LmbE family N-acetylglucosaminyl deacetylase
MFSTLRTAPGGFDTAIEGTPEADWQPLFERCGNLSPLCTPLVVVAPHPDDETFGAGGLLLRYPGARVISVSDGEAASSLPNLRHIRQRELRRALSIPSGIRLTRLGLPDGRIATRERHLEDALHVLVDGARTLVAPYERDGHPDHDSVGRVCRRVARRNRMCLLRYLIWRWHLGSPEELRRNRVSRVSLSPLEQKRKRRMMACYASQLSGGSSAVVPPHVLRYFCRSFEVFLQGESA